MVKTTKGGRVMNPADAHRKEQRKKEVQRNKLERKYTREACSNRDKPEHIREQLQEIIDIEEAGPLNKAMRLKKKVLQEAYEHALHKKKEDDLRQKSAAASASGPPTAAAIAAGALRPEDSRYYHPTLNPTGKPPPGKMAAGLITAPAPAPPQPSAAGSAAAAAAGKEKASATITGSSTVVKRPLAQNDRALTSMVPPAVRVRRETAKPAAKPVHKAAAARDSAAQFGFGLAPVQRSAITSAPDLDGEGPGAASTTAGGAPGAQEVHAPAQQPSAVQPQQQQQQPQQPKQAAPVSTDAQYQDKVWSGVPSPPFFSITEVWVGRFREFLSTMKELGAF
ncbi:hypothetical protein DUNSADRAFT_4525 [Dunaliella salina]|uniref:Wbp11/ELF5/Saf1 N-terminal domain-containing protein n=1 Tax=Dunaliella salina TaxID=3046 RepID=A0ABQ7GRW0_DUNSA|nr:hypothetical protein DUNSADRAFT_4525 [Dunaliella salina]|eukprot:KAF5837317.1 hypothetical protein DUNSADRAFT_4525 [Dunaliella salina]